MDNQEDSWRLPDGTGLLPSVESVPVSPLRAAIPSAVWLVWASEGEYSDRSEWPVVATTDRASGERLVERLTELWRSADQKWRRIEPNWYEKGAVEAFWRDDVDAAEYARLTGDTGWLGGFYTDERSFTCCEVRLLDASAIEARRGETQSGSIADESAAPQADAQPSSEPTP